MKETLQIYVLQWSQIVSQHNKDEISFDGDNVQKRFFKGSVSKHGGDMSPYVLAPLFCSNLREFTKERTMSKFHFTPIRPFQFQGNELKYQMYVL